MSYSREISTFRTLIYSSVHIGNTTKMCMRNKIKADSDSPVRSRIKIWKRIDWARWRVKVRPCQTKRTKTRVFIGDGAWSFDYCYCERRFSCAKVEWRGNNTATNSSTLNDVVAKQTPRAPLRRSGRAVVLGVPAQTMRSLEKLLSGFISIWEKSLPRDKYLFVLFFIYCLHVDPLWTFE